MLVLRQPLVYVLPDGRKWHAEQLSIKKEERLGWTRGYYVLPPSSPGPGEVEEAAPETASSRGGESDHKVMFPAVQATPDRP